MTGSKVFNYLSQAHTDTKLGFRIHILVSLYPKPIHILHHTRFVWSQHLVLERHTLSVPQLKQKLKLKHELKKNPSVCYMSVSIMLDI